MKSKLKIVFFVLLMTILMWYISTYWYQLVLVHGKSMEPTYKSGQLIVIKKYGDTYRTGDVIVFRNHDKVLVKRIVACEGDVVEINNQIYVLLADEYFVMGDNRNESIDSRNEEVGIVDKTQILGVVENYFR